VVFKQPYEHESKQFNITVSIGISYSNDAESINDLLAHADQALYQAKDENRNKLVTYIADYKPGD
jgi:diguanylate cyclase (GGDEF)-like protein